MHEQTITIDIEEGGRRKYINIPTVVKGVKLSDKEASDYHILMMKSGKKYDKYDTVESAVEAARKRSESFPPYSHPEGTPEKGRSDLWTPGLLKSNKRLLNLKGRAKQRTK